MKPIFFKNQLEFRSWLEKNYENEKEILVGFYKVHTKKPSITWSESVNQALCFGWIDGVRKSIDKDSYSIRFTPRNKNSIWSPTNIKKIEMLTKDGLITQAGLKAFSYYNSAKSAVYLHRKKDIDFSDELKKQFEKEKQALQFFENQAPSYQKTIKHWVMSAKQEKTQQLRLQKVIDACNKNKRLS